MATQLLNKGLYKIINQQLNLLTDTIQVMIVSPAHVFDINAEFVSDIAADEVTNAELTGYQRKALANRQLTLDEDNDRVYFTADNPSYDETKTNEDLASAYIIKSTGDDATSPLVAIVDFEDMVTNKSKLELLINAGGILRFNNTPQA